MYRIHPKGAMSRCSFGRAEERPSSRWERFLARIVQKDRLYSRGYTRRKGHQSEVRKEPGSVLESN